LWNSAFLRPHNVTVYVINNVIINVAEETVMQKSRNC
jgi:hypothetical protein